MRLTDGLAEEEMARSHAAAAPVPPDVASGSLVEGMVKEKACVTEGGATVKTILASPSLADNRRQANAPVLAMTSTSLVNDNFIALDCATVK